MSWFFLRRKFVVFLILVFALFIVVYAKKEMFFQQAKQLIKQNLEKSLLPAQLSFEKIRAGLFYGLVLEKLEISFPQDLGFTCNIKVDEACIDYNLWEAIFSDRKKDIQQLRLISPVINLSYPSYVTRLRSTNVTRLRDPVTQSTGEFVLVLEGGRISFGKSRPLLKNLQGEILLTQKGLYFQDFRASFKDNLPNTLKIYGELSKDSLCLTANVEHLKINDFDILTNFALDLNKKRDLQNKAQKVCGHLKTYGSVFNNRPIPELNSSFEIQDAKLRILTFSLGDNYDLRGIVSLTSPNNCDLCLNFYQAAPAELISQFGFPEKPNFSGLVNGLIKITGAIGRPKIEGYLEAKQGRLGDLDFVSADINIKGRYPKISIVDSRILREEDSFLMKGEIDLTSLERQNFLDISIKADKGMFWQGWDITRRRDNQVHMSKSVADDVKVTFDTFIDDGTTGFQDNYRNELGLEYRIFGDKLLKLRLRKEEEILGIERRISF